MESSKGVFWTDDADYYDFYGKQNFNDQIAFMINNIKKQD